MFLPRTSKCVEHSLQNSQDESAVLFVVDTSGSMCVTTAVPGRISLRGDRTKDLARLLSAGVSWRLVAVGTVATLSEVKLFIPSYGILEELTG